MIIIKQHPKKKIVWVKSTYKRLLDFPKEVSHQAGYQLNRLQQGKMPEDWKPMSVVGPGVCEIRIHYPAEYRVLYVANFEEAVYVLHVFLKKSQKTLLRELIIAKDAYAEVKKKRNG